MGTLEMQEVAKLYARVLLHSEDPSVVKDDVAHLKSDFQTIRYCFNEENINGYPF
jgi:glycine hydroxymethyltransferase